MQLINDTQQTLLDDITATRAKRDAILQQPEATRDTAQAAALGREIATLTAAFNAETVRASAEQLARLRARPEKLRKPQRERALEDALRVRGVEPDAAIATLTGGAN